jgi:glycosyltransferase involved in cell wall biosynthesis
MLFVPRDDPAALAVATHRILADDALATQLCAGARAYAAQFTWPAIARQHLALYDTLTAPAPRNEAVAVAASEGDR